ncbi:MAG: YggS family pyridoxal phosphate-dependent enzyme [Lachnospiraceae bacterium]|nr:YggS family pyridoxal phosphate-dependent enzyme [Lachnospiraceae bacterium]
MIQKNYRNVELKVAEACKRAGRKRENVTLIAVSKTKPISDIKEVLALDVLDFGENKVQELCEKEELLDKNIRWHLIGHLQRNKVKYIIDKTFLIHSVDSYRLALQLEEECCKKNVECDILIEVNVAEEDSKFGVTVDATLPLVEEISKLPHVHIKGLMTIAPYTEDAESNRKYFRKLRELAVDIMAKNIDNVSMHELSMGMTGDYEVAIEEGATLVRVGTGIFGERNYNI